MLLELKRLTVPPGHQLLLSEVSWQEFEKILAELGEKRSARLSYSNGVLEIMTPLMGHETSKVLIGDLVKIMLDEMGLDYEPTGSTTFKNQSMKQAVEPDESFYIQNCQAVRGLQRVNLQVQPPPDLAIEIDITSRTKLDNYRLLGVPELWRYNGKTLQINLLRSHSYLESEFSPTFPGIPLLDKIPQTIEQSKTVARGVLLKSFRRWFCDRLQSRDI
ncbi:MAG: Uma2 family endonuclease [Oscillatoria sp. SIO1A7]|nr:Uma2 family endonuclease [Oscillatoria sp. SIO1A7]